MRTYRGVVRQLRGDDRGATAAEYALIAALIAVVIIAAVTLLGGSVFGLFDTTSSSFAAF
jgi:pilus assembly protein Flp/PilA